MLNIDTTALEAFIEKIVDAWIQALGPKLDDPW
jgi:hypothetical protein